MIRNLTGTLSHKGENYVVLDVSGVGYMIFTPQMTFSIAQKGELVSLWTHMAVRENAIELYGFVSKKELDFFEMLINISGIGPKSGLSILNLAPVEHLMSAIATGDNAYLTKVSGIGKKNAAKIIIELKEKLETLTEGSDTPTLREETDALDALTALGYTTIQAREALREIGDNATNTNQKIKEALKYLGKS